MGLPQTDGKSDNSTTAPLLQLAERKECEMKSRSLLPAISVGLGLTVVLLLLLTYPRSPR